MYKRQSTAGGKTIQLYNPLFKDKSTSYDYDVDYYQKVPTVLPAKEASGEMVDGVVTVNLKVDPLNNTVKTRDIVIDKLNNEKAVSFEIGASHATLYNVQSVTVPTGKSLAQDSYTFGTPVTVTVKITQAVPQKYVELTFSSEFKDRGVADIVVKVPTEVTSVYQTVTFTVYPMASGTYTLTGAAWA